MCHEFSWERRLGRHPHALAPGPPSSAALPNETRQPSSSIRMKCSPQALRPHDTQTCVNCPPPTFFTRSTGTRTPEVRGVSHNQVGSGVTATYWARIAARPWVRAFDSILLRRSALNSGTMRHWLRTSLRTPILSLKVWHHRSPSLHPMGQGEKCAHAWV